MHCYQYSVRSGLANVWAPNLRYRRLTWLTWQETDLLNPSQLPSCYCYLPMLKPRSSPSCEWAPSLRSCETYIRNMVATGSRLTLNETLWTRLELHAVTSCQCRSQYPDAPMIWRQIYVTEKGMEHCHKVRFIITQTDGQTISGLLSWPGHWHTFRVCLWSWMFLMQESSVSLFTVMQAGDQIIGGVIAGLGHWQKFIACCTRTLYEVLFCQSW